MVNAFAALDQTDSCEEATENQQLQRKAGAVPAQSGRGSTQTGARAGKQRHNGRFLTLTGSEEIFIKSSGPGVPTSIIISFN